MKKYLSIILFFGFGVVSCKKEYTCECTKVVLSSNEQTTTTHEFESRQSSSQKTCNDYANTDDGSTLSNYEPSETTCSLK